MEFWPLNIKDWEVFGKTGYLQAVGGNTLRTRTEHSGYDIQKLDTLAAYYRDYIPYLTAVLRLDLNSGDDLSSLKNNVIIVKILNAAKGKR